MQTKILQKFMKKNVPDINTGDTVKVSILVIEGEKERVQVFEGLVIATKHGKGLDGTFIVRKEFHGIGVERIFPLHSPRIIKVERIKQSKVRRSKLYFMRELKGKQTRMKELNRDYMMWEEPEAEEELAKIEAEKAKAAEAEKAKKQAKEKELEEKVRAVAGDRIKDDKKDLKEVDPGSKKDEKKPETVEEKADEAKEKK